jgi:two-component system, NtrC family, response regulator HydG
MTAQLIVESGAASPHLHDLDENAIARLGRANDNTIVLRDRHASRRHTRVYFEAGHWRIRDEEETKNHTLVDGKLVIDELSLCNGQTIAIGEVRIRFQLDDAEAETIRADEMHLVSVPKADTTLFETADLESLFHFTSQSLSESTLDDLVARALQTVLDQTGADHAGYLSLDEATDLRLILPAESKVDQKLSQRLTQLVEQKRCMVWLCAPDAGTLGGDSLSEFRDAVCVPVPGVGTEAPLGALHAYLSTRLFTARQARFCEVVASCLASALHLLRSRKAREADISRLLVHAPQAGELLIGSSQTMAALRKHIQQLAPRPCTVLIRGETGVGKELVALKLHRQSQRHRGPFVPVNCATITGTLAESLLFGHVKGGFTGAVRDHAGFFAQADMGTLFLDELGTLPMEIQVKLLRVLETRQFTPVGSDKSASSDVRVVAATNCDLEKAVKHGEFRDDLYYRFIARIDVPALRDHLEDVPELVRHFLEHLRREYRHSVELSEGALSALANYTWPGNVRQLRSKLEGALAMAENHSTINASDFSLPAKEDSGVEMRDRPTSLLIEDVERWAIRHALAKAKENQTQAARILGMHRSTLSEKLKKYRLG